MSKPFKSIVCVAFVALTLVFVSCEDYQSGQCETYARSEGWPTASGEPFNSSAMTGAHATLPFGTKVLVRTGYSYNIVRINDRVEFDDGKIMHLTTAASKRLIFHEGLPCYVDWSKNCCAYQQFEP